MIGLGRMGANMVRRLHARRTRMRGATIGNAEAVKGLAAEGARGAHSLAESRGGAACTARRVDHGACGHRRRVIADLRPLLKSRATSIIDGGNSHYHEDIRRAQELRAAGIHYVDVGTSGGVLGLERGFCLMIGGEREVVASLAADVCDSCSGRRGERARHRPAGLPALRALMAPGTSSRWSTTASSTG